MTASLLRRAFRKTLPALQPLMRGKTALRSLTRLKAITFVAYHEVANGVPEGLAPGLVVSPARFRQEIDWLAAHFQIIPIAEAFRRLDNGRLENHAVVISFDDGYRGTLDEAYPVLREKKIPATFFLNADFLQHRAVGLRLKLEWLLARYPRKALAEQLPAAADRNAFVALAKTTISDETRRRIDALCADSGGQVLHERYLSVEDLKQLSPELITIGNHSRSHAWLAGLTQAQQEEEILGGINALALLPHYQPYFALPFGTPESFDETTLSLVRRYYSGNLLTAYGGINRRTERKSGIRNVLRNCVSETKPPLLELLWSNDATNAITG